MLPLDRCLPPLPEHEGRLVEEHQRTHAAQPAREQRVERDQPRLDGRRGPRERELGLHPGLEQRHAERERSDHLRLHPRDRRRVHGGDVEEAEQPGV